MSALLTVGTVWATIRSEVPNMVQSAVHAEVQASTTRMMARQDSAWAMAQVALHERIEAEAGAVRDSMFNMLQLIADRPTGRVVYSPNITVRLTQNQFDALVSFVYNLGPGTFRNGSLPRLINQRSDALAISAKWREYRMAGGRVLQGLVNRRRDELFLYWRHLWSLAIILFFAAGIMLTASAYTLNA
jgi:hypothetical protein